MYRIIIVLTLVAGLFPTLGMAQDDARNLETERERVSYTVGLEMGQMLIYGKEMIDLEVFLKGIKDKFDGTDPLVSTEDVDSIMREFEAASTSNQQRIESEAESKFLQVNGEQKGVVKLASGLQYKVLQAGNGKSPVAYDRVRTHYEGRFLSGEVFDSSYERGAPVTFPVNRVIPGWTEALQLMKEGDKWELYVPYALAYGEQGAPPRIPPFSTLVFQVELLEILPEGAGMSMENHGHPH